MSTVAKFTYAQALRSSIVSPSVDTPIVQNTTQIVQENENDKRARLYIESLQREANEKRERAQVQAHLRRGKAEGPFTNPYQWDNRMAYLKYVLDRKW